MKLKIKYNSPVVLTFALVSLVVLLLGELTGGWTNGAFFSVYRASFTDPLSYVRLFGHVLGHSSLAHYTSNIMLLLVIGPMLEEKYGASLMVSMMAVTAAVSGILHCIVSSSTMLLGASGIVFMLILLASFSGVDGKTIPLTLILVAAVYLGQEIYAGMFADDNVSHFTHIVGGLCGAAFGFLLGRRHRRPEAMA